ncbi:MAG: DNA polymerase III subunit beta, partial [Myxococcota bacterium]
MELRITKVDLLRALYAVQGIADRRATMPILGNVLLRTEGKGRLLCAATDLSLSVTIEVDAVVKKEGGITLGAKQLFDIVKGLPDGEIRFSRSETQRAEIRAGKVEFHVVGLADRDFPRLPDHREVKLAPVDAKLLREMIAKSIFASSTDETRLHLCGVLLEAVGGHARMVATDGHRLAKIERDWKSGPEISPAVLVPRRALLEIRRLIESIDGVVQMGLAQGTLFLRAGEAVLSAKLADAVFPPYEQVIPRENDKVLVMDRVALLEALKRVSLVASDRTYGIKFEAAPGELRVTSDNPDVGDAREQIDLEYKGAALSVGFNARYLIDLLSEMGSEQVRAELAGELDAALFRPVSTDDYLGVVMPMRI